jgi:hypothetical protein
MCMRAQVRAQDKSHRDEIIKHLLRAIRATARRARDPYLDSSDEEDAV